MKIIKDKSSNLYLSSIGVAGFYWTSNIKEAEQFSCNLFLTDLCHNLDAEGYDYEVMERY